MGEAVPARIYLTGFMGAGKTRVGTALAEILRYRFLDLDREIEARAEASARQIFEQQGEEAFRDVEHQALTETELCRDVVVATGGGVVTLERNRRLLRRLGRSVWLCPSFETILGWLDERARAKRPLFRDEERARALYHERLAAYRTADLKIEIAASETARSVAARIAAHFEGEICDT